MHLHDRAGTLACLLYKAENSAVSASNETELARCERCAFGEHRDYFTSLKNPPFIDKSA